MTVRNYKVYR